MALFDPENIRSAEFAALWHMVDLLTECDAVKVLAEAVGADDAAKKIDARKRFTVGPQPTFWDADDCTEEEAENRFIEFQLFLPEEGGRSVIRSDGSFDRADETGDFYMVVRRLCRKAELAAFNTEAQLDGRQDVYAFFADAVSAMEQEAMTRAEFRECPRLQAFNRQIGPSFGAREWVSMQGECLMVRYAITWGDPIGQQ